MNKPAYLGLSISELNKIVMYEFWNDYVKWKYDKKAKLYYMETDSFFVYIKTDDICKEIAEDVETRFETSNYQLDRPLPKEKNKKVIGLMKDEICGKIMKTFLDLKAKSYLIDDGGEGKEVKYIKMCVIKNP